MGILDIEIVKGFMRMCNDGWLQGWHERNGGNLTYRMTGEEDVYKRQHKHPPHKIDRKRGLDALPNAAAAARTQILAAERRHADEVHGTGALQDSDACLVYRNRQYIYLLTVQFREVLEADSDVV